MLLGICELPWIGRLVAEAVGLFTRDQTSVGGKLHKIHLSTFVPGFLAWGSMFVSWG